MGWPCLPDRRLVTLVLTDSFVSGEENVNDAGGVCLCLCTATYTSRSKFSKAEFLWRCTSGTAAAAGAVVEVPLVVRTPLFLRYLFHCLRN